MTWTGAPREAFEVPKDMRCFRRDPHKAHRWGHGIDGHIVVAGYRCPGRPTWWQRLVKKIRM